MSIRKRLRSIFRAQPSKEKQTTNHSIRYRLSRHEPIIEQFMNTHGCPGCKTEFTVYRSCTSDIPTPVSRPKNTHDILRVEYKNNETGNRRIIRIPVDFKSMVAQARIRAISLRRGDWNEKPRFDEKGRMFELLSEIPLGSVPCAICHEILDLWIEFRSYGRGENVVEFPWVLVRESTKKQDKLLSTLTYGAKKENIIGTINC